jgi:hypothetical protein
VEWALIRAAAAVCRWAADTGADSGERQWEEARHWEVASVAAWEWEAADSAAGWEAGWEADTEEGAGDTASTGPMRRTVVRATAASDMMSLCLSAGFARERAPGK